MADGGILVVWIFGFVGIVTFMLGHGLRYWWKNGSWGDPPRWAWKTFLWFAQVFVFFFVANLIWTFLKTGYGAH